MARSISTAKTLSSLIADHSSAIVRSSHSYLICCFRLLLFYALRIVIVVQEFFFADNELNVFYRRGYASASQGGVSEAAVRGSVVTMMKKGGEDSTKSTAWVPDPVTGYYKPEGHGNQIDAAELRELLLKQKTRRD